MKIEIRPPDGVLVIREILKETKQWHLYAEDESENSFSIILTESQFKDLKEQMNRKVVK